MTDVEPLRALLDQVREHDEDRQHVIEDLKEEWGNE